ncbi:MAG: tetratricopeptide repeat protein, partial [bacterium]
LLGNIHYRLGDYQVAIKHYRSVSESLTDPVPLFGLARSYLEIGKYKRARKALNRGLNIIQRSGQNAIRDRFITALARVDLKMDRPAETIRRLRTLNRSSWTSQHELLYARALIAQGRDNQSRRILKQLLEGKNVPDGARSLYNKLEKNIQSGS